MNSLADAHNPSRWKQAFFLAMLTAAILFLPFVIWDRGYFIYYGDFNVQQIPFYQLAHEAVRGGDIFWSWYTDLGANFFGSYSFYLLFSPFFWLTLPFPTAVVPYFMAPLLVLKTACASLTAYLFLERFMKDKGYAVLGALLYAFSGWMDYNIFFNHFHEAAIFFPLLLLGVEKLVTENNRGFFAAMVAVNAMVNYWFFVGEVVFVVLYVLVRMRDREWGMNWGKFSRLALESVAGVAIAGVVLVPSVLALMGNPRTEADKLALGWNFWLYWHEQRSPAILQSLFFPPELPARLNFFPEHGAKWSSLSAWLPMVGMTGVLTYFFSHRQDWVKRILVVSLVFAMVPGLNSLFILLNNSYYARWFYMPLLVMALASGRAFEDCRYGADSFLKAARWTLGIILVFAVMCGLTPKLTDNVLSFGLAENPTMMWLMSAFAGAGLAATVALVRLARAKPGFYRLLCGGVMLMAVVFGVFYILNGKITLARSRALIETSLHGREKINLPADDTLSRVDVFEGTDNQAMFWHLPNIQAFHSIVPPSIMEFYPEVGVKRDVGSRPEKEFYALRTLLSVRWLFIEQDNKNQEPMPGFSFYSEQNEFNIYENKNYIPFGFAYDRFVDPDSFRSIKSGSRGNLLLRAVVLDHDAIPRNQDILEYYDVGEGGFYSYDEMEEDAQDRRQYTAYAFERDTRGFTARTNWDEEKLIFFSVPYESGWSASVNGSPALIEKVNIGFMAVRVPAGESVIRFDYFTPGLKAGAVLSGAGLALLLGYLLFFRRSRKAADQERRQSLEQYAQEEQRLSFDEFKLRYGERERRRIELQQALNRAEARHISDQLPPEEKTLRFTAPDLPPDQAADSDGAEPETKTQDGEGSP